MRKWIKRLAVFLAVIVFLIIALVLFLHTPWVKSIVRNEVRKYLVNKLKTPVEIGKIDYRLPAWIQIKELLVLDRGKDTLLYGGNVYVKIDMLKLISSNIDVGAVQLDNIVLKINREPHDVNFNFQYILDAFSSPGDPEKLPDTSTNSSSEPLKLNVGVVLLNNIRLRFFHKKEKQYYSLQLGTFFWQPERISLEKNAFRIDQLYTSNCIVNMIDSAKSVPDTSGHMENSPYEPPTAFVALKKLGFKNIQLVYKKPLDKFDLKVLLDTMQMDQSSIDLAEQKFTGRKFLLHNSEFNLNAWIKETKPKTEKELIQNTAEATGWKARLDFIDLFNNSIVYHNNAVKRAEGLDYNHLEVKDFNFASSENILNGHNFSTKIDSCSLIANNKINLKGFRTKASFSDSLVLVKDLEIGLNRSALITQGDLVWELKRGKSARKGNFDCRVQHSSIAYADLLAIQPDLARKLPINLPQSGNLNFSRKIRLNS